MTTGLIPPRLPEPPENIDRQYMLDLLRAIELFIQQERSFTTLEESQSISFFLK
jgi:hypothetical protein|tara:strand:+ start:570 stop:731 length:162 start_codon:yes stop_codon:yes gene_type:complete